MPARTRRKVQAADQRAALLASMLSPTVPAPVALLCHDLNCVPSTLKETVLALSERGVHAYCRKGAYLADKDTWSACKKFALTYRD